MGRGVPLAGGFQPRCRSSVDGRGALQPRGGVLVSAGTAAFQRLISVPLEFLCGLSRKDIC